MNKVRQNSNREIQSESKQNKPKVKKFWEGVGKVALASTLLFGGSKLAREAGRQPSGGQDSEDITDVERVADAERIDVDSITIHGGPNLRSDSYVPGDPNSTMDKDNLIMDLGNSDQKIELNHKFTVYARDDRDDSNGVWYGFPAKEFANAMYESSYIDEGARDRIIKKSKGVVWINGEYVDLNEGESTGEHTN